MYNNIKSLIIFLSLFPLSSVLASEEPEYIFLYNVQCAGLDAGKDSIITCLLTFSETPQDYSYDYSYKQKEAIFVFNNTGLSGVFSRDSVIECNRGPVKKIGIQYRRSDIVQVIIEFDPAPKYSRDIKMEIKGNAIHYSFLWPNEMKTRKKLYIYNKKKKGGVVFTVVSILGISLAAAGYFLWKNDILEFGSNY